MARTRRIRTIFYADQALTPAELEILHTPALQRLYDLHQLGLTDRVFIDASHSRLQHVVGVVHNADKLISSIAHSLRSESKSSVRSPLKVGPPNNLRTISLLDLASYVDRRRPSARLMGLLHDLTHSPYGHTLEDEIGLIDSKHDEPDRQAISFYRLLCHLIGWLARENLWTESLKDIAPAFLAFDKYLGSLELIDPPSLEHSVQVTVALLRSNMKAQRMAHDFGPTSLDHLLRDLFLAMQALLRLELLHKKEEALLRKPLLVPRNDPYQFETLIERALALSESPLTPSDYFCPYKDSFLIDLIGNTVCADLLDYARRDAHFTNIKTAYDPDRIVESFTLVAYDSAMRSLPVQPERIRIDPFFGNILRPAIAVFTHKLRIDVVGGVLDLLHARYDLYERALFHSTKCVAGAMLGRALQMMYLKPLPPHMVFLGDQVFLREAAEAGRLVRRLLGDAISDAGQVDAELDDQLFGRIKQLLSIGALPQVPVAATVNEPKGSSIRSGPFFASEPLGVIVTAGCILANLQEHAKSAPQQASSVLRRLDGAILLLDRLLARRFHRTVFRLLPTNEKCGEGACLAADKEKPQVKIIAEFFTNPDHRAATETGIEEALELPPGSVVIHCPPYGGPAKIAEVLLVVREPDGAERHETLRKAEALHNGMFAHHVDAVGALEEMYWSTWRLTVSVAAPFFLKWKSIEARIATEIVNQLVKAAKFHPNRVVLSSDPLMLFELELADRRSCAPEEEIASSDVLATNGNPAFIETAATVIEKAIESGELQPPDYFENWPVPIVEAIRRAQRKRVKLSASVARTFENNLQKQLEDVISSYDLQGTNRLRVIGNVIPEFVDKALAAITERPDLRKRLFAMVAERIPEDHLYRNRAQANTIRLALEALLIDLLRLP